MKKEINPVLKRLAQWAEEKGGFAEIGRGIGKHPAMFYNLVRRDALPSLATLAEIAKVFPDLDLNFIIRGEPSVQTADSDVVRSLRAELAREKSIANALIAKDKGAITSPGVDRRHLRASATQMMSAVRDGAKFTPGRAQENAITSLIAGVRDRVRMQ